MNGKIYVIKNNINNKVYIGQTIQEVEIRFKQHLKCNKSNKNQLIQKAILKYGKSNFYAEILKDNITTYEELNYWEEYFIKEFNSLEKGYNLCPGGQKWRKQPSSITISNKNLPTIINMYLVDEKSTREIASVYNVSHKTIQQILKDNNVILRNKSSKLPNRKTKVNFELIEPLLNEGLSIYAIARRLKACDRTIKRIISNHNS
jgi:group I intron endonuclease